MIIPELIEYANRNGLGEPGYVPKFAICALVCDTKNGNTPVDEDFDIKVLGNPDDKKNRGIEFKHCPETPGLNSGGKSHVLLETIEVVFGLNKNMLDTDKEKTAEEKIKKNPLLAKHDFFVQALEKMATVLPEAARFVSFLNDPVFREKMYRKLTEEKKIKGIEKITLRAVSIETGENVFLIDETRWCPWWEEYRKNIGKQQKDSSNSDPDNEDSSKKTPKSAKKKNAKESQSNLMISLANGEAVEPQMTHNMVMELGDVGAISSGASFIGFDKASFQSYGLEQSANAAMDENSASKYRAALNEIFKNRSKKFGSLKIGYWYKMPVPPDEDPIVMLDGSKDEEDLDIIDELDDARDLLNSWEKGKKSPPLENRYYSLILSANSGRIMIRDWKSGDLIDWVRAAAKWFADTEITRRDGSDSIRQHKFNAIASSFFSNDLKKAKDKKSRDKIWAAHAETILLLWEAALNQKINIPENAVALALNEIRTDMFGDKDGNSIPPNHARMGLLRAYLVRNKGDNNMNPYLNEDHPDVAYQCGRLMSLIADLQYDALGKVNAGIVQRFYSAASVTPQLVLGRLMRMCQFYIAKPGSGNLIEKQIANVWGKIKENIPQTFDLKQQTLFAQGYYQEQAVRWKNVADATAEKNKKSTEKNENSSDENSSVQ